MKKIIKKHYRFIRKLNIIIIVMIMSISAFGIGFSANYISKYHSYTSITHKIAKIEKKAKKGKVYDWKNLYVQHWTDELTQQHEKAIVEKERLVRRSNIAKWIDGVNRFEAFLLKIIFILAIGYGLIVEYSSILSLARKIHDRHEFLTDPQYFKYWNWKRKYQYVKKKSDARKSKDDAMKWIRSLK